MSLCPTSQNSDIQWGFLIQGHGIIQRIRMTNLRTEPRVAVQLWPLKDILNRMLPSGWKHEYRVQSVYSVDTKPGAKSEKFCLEDKYQAEETVAANPGISSLLKVSVLWLSWKWVSLRVAFLEMVENYFLMGNQPNDKAECTPDNQLRAEGKSHYLQGDFISSYRIWLNNSESDKEHMSEQLWTRITKMNKMNFSFFFVP